jgi:hypothetical protein
LQKGKRPLSLSLSREHGSHRSGRSLQPCRFSPITHGLYAPTT